MRQHGGPEVLGYEEIADPSPAPDEVLVRVRACGVNNLDTQIRRGIPGVAIDLPHVLGCDIAGEAVATGERVIVSPGVGCGACAACRAENDSACARYAMLGYQRHGGYAELVRVPARAVLPVSDRWSFEEWASAPLVFLTAWRMLFTRARLASGETVLVLAAGSGVGIAAVQLAKHAGARVIATAGSDAKLEKAKALGADAGVNYTRDGWHKEVRQLTDGAGAHVVIEHTGADTWPGSLAALARGGRLVTCGATTGPHVALDIRHLFVKQLSILGSYMGSLRELRDVVLLLERGDVAPVVDTVFPLAEARAAHARIASRGLFGKIVLAP